MRYLCITRLCKKTGRCNIIVSWKVSIKQTHIIWLLCISLIFVHMQVNYLNGPSTLNKFEKTTLNLFINVSKIAKVECNII